MNGKGSDTGWFYHAPHKANPNSGPVGAPIPSQVPGLSDVSQLPPDPEPRRILINEGDSKYIRMCKQGGRPDLLRQRTPPPKKEQRGYPKVDWYYLEDNRMEDAPPRDQPENYEFMLPDYMCHETVYTGEGDINHGAPHEVKRLPYGFDKTTVFERDGRSATDKTVKLPELKKTGYGVRQDRMKNTPVKYNMPKREMGKAPNSQNEKKYVPMEGVTTAEPQLRQEEHSNMGKILSFGYVTEWNESRDKWQHKQTKLEEKFADASKDKNARLQSEYQQQMTSQSASKSRHSAAKSRERKPETPQNTQKKHENDAELFKMSKFKNVPPRVDHKRTAKAY